MNNRSKNESKNIVEDNVDDVCVIAQSDSAADSQFKPNELCILSLVCRALRRQVTR